MSDETKKIKRASPKKWIQTRTMQGMCSETRSCTINEGLDFGSVFVVTHEMGHRYDSFFYFARRTLSKGSLVALLHQKINHEEWQYFERFQSGNVSRRWQWMRSPLLYYVAICGNWKDAVEFVLGQGIQSIRYGWFLEIINANNSTHFQKLGTPARAPNCLRDLPTPGEADKAFFKVVPPSSHRFNRIFRIASPPDSNSLWANNVQSSTENVGNTNWEMGRDLMLVFPPLNTLYHSYHNWFVSAKSRVSHPAYLHFFSPPQS